MLDKSPYQLFASAAALSLAGRHPAPTRTAGLAPTRPRRASGSRGHPPVSRRGTGDPRGAPRPG